MAKKPNLINLEEIPAGENKIMNLHVGRLPSGTRIFIKTNIFRGKEPGPVLMVSAGMHGDEVNGVEIVRRAIESGMFHNLQRGTVIAIPVINIYGFINFSRSVPDGKDVNRSFPGSARGSLASRVAKKLTSKVLPIIDFGIDFHTGGDYRYNFPQVRFSPRSDAAKHLAMIFNAPLTIESSVISKSFRKIARDHGKPILIYEGGESLRLDGLAIENAHRGLKRLLHYHKMKEYVIDSRSTQYITRLTWIRAASAGIFIWAKKSGHFSAKGETLGSIFDPYGDRRVPVKSSRDGFLVGHNNIPVVNQGDALFHLGYKGERLTPEQVDEAIDSTTDQS